MRCRDPAVTAERHHIAMKKANTAFSTKDAAKLTRIEGRLQQLESRGAGSGNTQMEKDLRDLLAWKAVQDQLTATLKLQIDSLTAKLAALELK